MIFSFILALLVILGTVLLGAYGVKIIITSKRKRISAVLFVCIILAGIAIGIHYGILKEFTVSKEMRIQGIPIPLVIFIREGADWADFVKPNVIGYPCMVANALFPPALGLLVWIAFVKMLRPKPNSIK